MIKNLQKRLEKLVKTKIFTRSKNPLVGGLGFFSMQKAPALHRIKDSGARAKRAFAVLALFLMPFLMVPNGASASLRDQLNDVNRQLKLVKEQLSDIQGQKQTLQNQVAAFDSQISSVEYQIYLTNKKISLLESQIKETEKEMAQAEKDLQVARNQLSEIIRVMYEDGQLSALEVVAKSGSFSEFVNRSEYMEQMQLKIKDGADKVIAIKNKLEAQKKQLESDQKEAETLKKAQVSQRNGLSQQKSVKDELLAATKGDEAEYRAMVAKLKKQYDAIQAKIWYGSSNYVSLGTVHAGDIIGRIGNTGFSTGCHLHFEVRTASKSTVNPASKIGDGYFIHPVPGVRVSAPYGYSSAYFNWFHSGIDYADGCAGTPIRAAADGEIVVRVTGRPNTYPWSYEYGNYVMIRHTNGMYTLYGHMR